MTDRTGFLCVWMVLLVASAESRPSPRKRAAGVQCRPKELITLTKNLMEESLAGFDKANGKHLGTWSPGFPELQVHQDSVHGPEVQCGLFFMAAGLQEVLEDQKHNLNPMTVSLHEKLQDTIFTVNMLAACVKSVLGGECSSNPSPPPLPAHVFERKQFGHTLLKTARDYLNWLQHKFVARITKIYVKNKRHGEGRRLHKYLEGSGFFL